MPFVRDPNQTPSGGFTPEKKSVAGFVGNVGKSGVNLVKGVGSALINTVNPNLEENTIANLAQTVWDTAGAGVHAVNGTEIPKTNKFRQLADFYKTRYGGLNNIGETFYHDPLGMAMDVSMVAGGAGALAKAGKLGETANVLNKVSEVTNPFAYVAKGAGAVKKVAAPMISDVGKTLETGSENLVTRGMGNPMKLKEAKAVSPIPMDELFSKYNTYERTPEAFQAAIDQASAKIEELTKQAAEKGSKVDVLKVLEEYNKEIKRLTAAAPTSDAAAQQLAELSRRKSMFIEAIGGTESTPLNVGVGKVKDIKNAFQGDMPKNAFAAPQGDLNKAGGTKLAYKGLIKGIEEAAPGTKEVGREQSALIKLKKIAENQTSRGSAKQVFNFTKLGSAGVGGVLAGVPGAIAGFATEQLLNSPAAIKFGSKVMKKVGQFLQGKDPEILKATYGIKGNTISEEAIKKIMADPEFQKVYQGTVKENPFVQDIIREMSGGNDVTLPPPKSVKTAAGKVLRKQMYGKTGYSVKDLGDIIRGNIIGVNDADVERIVAEIRKKYPQFNIEDNFNKPNNAGYRGYNINVETPGGAKGEIQVHTPETYERQMAIHPIYDEWRNVDPKKVPGKIWEKSRKVAARTEKVAKIRNNVFRKASATAKAGLINDTRR